MIIRRYLTSQVLSTSFAVSAILVLVMLGGRLVKYFGMAAAGKIGAGSLLTLAANRSLGFLTFILPLGFFAGLILVFSRLYVDREMDVLNSSGISRNRLGLLLWPMVLLMMTCEATLSLWAGPWGENKSNQMFTQQVSRNAFEMLKADEVVVFGDKTIYVKSVSKDRQTFDGLFYYQKSTQADQPDILITAKHAQRVVDASGKSSIIDLSYGRRYALIPGNPKYSQETFDYYRLILDNGISSIDDGQIELATTVKLIEKYKTNLEAKAELGWRVSIVGSMLVAILLALPLSKVNPRQGRFYKLIPAVVLFVTLIVALISVKSSVSKGSASSFMFLLVLCAYAAMGLFFSLADSFMFRRLFTKKNNTHLPPPNGTSTGVTTTGAAL